MDKRDVVYKITEVIYRHLGSAVSSEKIKDIVRELMGSFLNDPSAMHSAPDVENQDTAIITVFGKSKPGIVAGITGVLAENNVDITDITQTLLGKNFAMIIIVNLTEASVNITDLKAKLDVKAKELGTSVFAQNEELFKYMHRV